MRKNTTRATVVIGATMALVMAGTAAVAAHPGDRDERGMQRGRAGFGAGMDDQRMPGLRASRGVPGRLGFADEDFERREVTLQTADGVTIRRVEQGAVDRVAADALSFSLGSGEAVTVVIDEDTQVVALEEQEMTVRGWSRMRLAPTEVEAEAIEAGAEITVWSEAEDGEDFVAARVVVLPAATEDEAETDGDDVADVDEAGTDETTVDTIAEDAPSTDA